LDTGDEVVGIGLVDSSIDLLAVLSNGFAKRVQWDDFPAQGRYGRGVTLWNLPQGVTVAGLAFGKGTQIVTLHLLKGAPRSCRIDDAAIKKRSAAKGDAVSDLRADDKILFVTSPRLSIFDKNKPKPVEHLPEQPSLFKDAPKAGKSPNKRK